MKRLVGLLLLASTLVLVGGTATASGDEPKPDAGMAGKLTVAPGHKEHGAGTNYALECTVTSSAPNTNLDCDDPFPNNEPDIVVDPADPNHMVASSNDYGSCCDEFYTTLRRRQDLGDREHVARDPQRDRQRPGHRRSTASTASRSTPR